MEKTSVLFPQSRVNIAQNFKRGTPTNIVTRLLLCNKSKVKYLLGVIYHCCPIKLF